MFTELQSPVCPLPCVLVFFIFHSVPRLSEDGAHGSVVMLFDWGPDL